jgi:hypothetical protein
MIIHNLTESQAENIQAELKVMAENNPHLAWQLYSQEGVKPHPIHHEDPRNPIGTTRFDEVDREIFLGDKYLTPVEERLQRIEEKVDTLLNRLDLIFGDHAMVNGRFVDLNNPPKG